MTIKEKAKYLKNKITIVFLAYKHKDTPIIAKAAALVTIAYALSPIDLIPDFIPILGYLDDIIILPLLIAFCIKLIPDEILQECEIQAQSQDQTKKTKKWFYAIPIILIWVLIGTLIYFGITNKTV